MVVVEEDVDALWAKCVGLVHKSLMVETFAPVERPGNGKRARSPLGAALMRSIRSSSVVRSPAHRLQFLCRRDCGSGATLLHMAVPNPDLVKALLKLGAPTAVYDLWGRSPLMLAAKAGYTKSLRLLISATVVQGKLGLDVNQGAGTPTRKSRRASAAAAPSDAESELVELREVINTPCLLDGQTMLIKAVKGQHFGCVAAILKSHRRKAHVRVNWVDRRGWSALHYACYRGTAAIVSLLCARGANCAALAEGEDGLLWTPLLIALTAPIDGKRREGVVRALLAFADNPADLEWIEHATGGDGVTAQRLASMLKDDDNGALHMLLSDVISRLQMETVVAKPMIEWSPSEVGVFIANACTSVHSEVQQAVVNYKELFERHNIDGRLLLQQNITRAMLKEELGIESLGHRTRIIEAVRAAKSAMMEQSLAKKATADLFDGTGTPFIDGESIIMGEVLGVGFFGEVRRALWNGLTVAVKVVFRERFGNKSDVDLFLQEVTILSKLRHKHIVEFYGCAVRGVTAEAGAVVPSGTEQHLIVMEFLRNGTLNAFIKSRFAWIDEAMRCHVLHGIALAMAYLHSMKILHRDLTSRNIMLGDELVAKVIDFGLSRKEDKGDMTASVGCMPWCAPEVILGKPYGDSADVYSFAMVVYEVCVGQEPHAEFANAREFSAKVANEDFRPSISTVPVHWRMLIEDCWKRDASARPSFSQLVERISRINDDRIGRTAAAAKAAATFSSEPDRTNDDTSSLTAMSFTLGTSNIPDDDDDDDDDVDDDVDATGYLDDGYDVVDEEAIAQAMT